MHLTARCLSGCLPLFLALVLLPLGSMSFAANGTAEPGIPEVVDEGEAEFDEIEVLKKKAATEGDWQQNKDEQVAVSEHIFSKEWNKAPFDPAAFDYTPEQMQANWKVLMRGLRVPYPSPEYLRNRYQKFAAYRDSTPNFDGDYDKLSADVLDTWRLFFRGDYQDAMRKGETLGIAGRIPGKVAQIFYAIYLEPNLEDKHMLLQDAANIVREYGRSLDSMKKDKQYYADYIIIRIAYSYAIGRIAEDVPIPVAISRNYVFKVLDAANDILDLEADNPLGLAFRAGIDANIVRKVGKATGRITFGAKQTHVKEYFERALQQVPDMAIIRYEYGNALLYMDKKRQIDAALAAFKEAAATKPRFSMEALDSMYAAKRRKEIEALVNYPGSFRSFERKRLKYQKQNHINLYCVLPKVCPPFIIQP